MRLLHVVSSPADGSPCDQNCQGAAINLSNSGRLSEIGERAILDALTQRRDADAVYGDIEISGVVERRAAWSPTRLLAETWSLSPSGSALHGLSPSLVAQSPIPHWFCAWWNTTRSCFMCLQC